MKEIYKVGSIVKVYDPMKSPMPIVKGEVVTYQEYEDSLVETMFIPYNWGEVFIRYPEGHILPFAEDGANRLSWINPLDK